MRGYCVLKLSLPEVYKISTYCQLHALCIKIQQLFFRNYANVQYEQFRYNILSTSQICLQQLHSWKRGVTQVIDCRHGFNFCPMSTKLGHQNGK